jgi:ABC-type cobalamin transport system permease subunit
MKHLKMVNENYLKHMFEAWLIAIVFFISGVIVFIHSVFPFIFQTTASTMVKNILARTNKRQGDHE